MADFIKRQILNFLGEKMMKRAYVAETQAITDEFQLITLDASYFTKVQWHPGEKIKINIGDWTLRTYTPISIENHQMKILAHLHGRGPGSHWAKRAKVGDRCHVLGPSGSIDFVSVTKPFLIIGDETSFAVAATAQSYFGSRIISKFIFTVHSVENSLAALEMLEIPDAKIIRKGILEADLENLRQKLKEALSTQRYEQVFITGNAQRIQKIRALLKEEGFLPSQMRSIAYWSDTRGGLD